MFLIPAKINSGQKMKQDAILLFRCHVDIKLADELQFIAMRISKE